MKGHNYGLCRKCGKVHVHPKGFLNRHHTEKWKAEHSKVKTGTHQTESTKKKIAEANKISHNTPKSKAKTSKSMLKFISENPVEAYNYAVERGQAAIKAQREPPSDLECYMMAIIQKHNLRIQYTGTARKEWRFGRYTPDFTSMTKKDFVIDIFGDHWHGKAQKSRTKEQEEQKYRAHYNKYQYEWYPLWEHEIYAMSEEELVEWLKGKIGE